MYQKKKIKCFVKNLSQFIFAQVQYGEDGKNQKKKALNTESSTATENNKGKRSRRKTENVSR